MSHVFVPEKSLGTAAWKTDSSLLTGGRVMEGSAIGDGVEYRFPKGLLNDFHWLTLDMLLEGTELAVFCVTLFETGNESAEPQGAHYRWGLLNWCEARVRVPLTFVNQNRWMFDREAAVLKPCAGGKRVDIRNVDRLTLTILRIGTTTPIRWHMTPLRAQLEEPAKLTKPLLPKGILLDELGQSTLHEWPAKTRSVAELTARIHKQAAEAHTQKWPENFSKWGGWRDGPKLEGTGVFRTHNDGKRWWLVDPEGHLFWSAGMDCVGPRAEANIGGLESAVAWVPDSTGEFAAAVSHRKHSNGDTHVSFLATNYIRAFGPAKWKSAWDAIVLSQLRSFGMNTVANWSDWKMAKAGGFPYVRPLSENFDTTPKVFRDFPDVWHPHFAKDCATYAEQLRETLGDPAMIGYFLMNEPTWGFAQESPALGMLYNNETSETRSHLAEFLCKKYSTAQKLSDAWGTPATFEEIARGLWTKPISPAAITDLESFSTLMIDRLFRGMTDACKKVDPHHMNLGARYYTVPPEWCLLGMTCFDVFSLNAYARRIPADKYNMIAAKLNRPVLAGEWHFGALDVGLPSSGIGHVPNEADRGRSYRFYLEDAAACPSCIGVHYFQMYDQNALGRFDGENYNVGFVDVCNRPYTQLLEAARAGHERMYDVASGKVPPFADAPQHLPLLFI